MAEGDAVPFAAAAAAASPEVTAQAADAAEPGSAAGAHSPAAPVTSEPAKSAATEPAAPNTPPRRETVRLKGHANLRGRQQALGFSDVPPVSDIEDSLMGGCSLLAGSLEPPASAEAASVQPASSAAPASPQVQQEQQCGSPAARPVAVTQATREAAVQRILSAGDSRPTEGPAAASAAETLAWCTNSCSDPWPKVAANYPVQAHSAYPMSA